MILVPDEDGEGYLRGFIGSTFALQIVSMLHLFIKQCTIDIFFLDWERPAVSREAPVQSGAQQKLRKPPQVP